ncbi:MAG: hypothetical protein ACOVOQ_04600 [Flavobacterium sp.]
MTPETYIPDPTRFYNHQDDLVAFMMMVIAVLFIYIVWKEIMTYRERKDVNQALRDNTEVINKIYGAQNDKK